VVGRSFQQGLGELSPDREWNDQNCVEPFLQPKDEFWPDDISLRNATIFPDNRSYSSHTLTDIYLLGLAVQHAGRLVTMDAHISVACVRGANAQTICVI
jgi:hypothetical protein